MQHEAQNQPRPIKIHTLNGTEDWGCVWWCSVELSAQSVTAAVIVLFWGARAQ